MSDDEEMKPPPYGPKSYELLHLTDGDRGFYRSLAASAETAKPVDEFVVPARTGKAFAVKQGHLLRVECDEGAQVADLNVFNGDNPQEHFSSSLTRAIHGTHLTTADRLWSHPIYQRPMMTIVQDTVDRTPSDKGGLSHDLLFGMCDEKLYRRLTGRDGLPNCRDNLTKAVAEFGLAPEYVHDPFNIFMVTGVNDDRRLFYDPPRAKGGDFIDLYAEMECWCAISACPGASSGPNPGGLRIRILEAS